MSRSRKLLFNSILFAIVALAGLAFVEFTGRYRFHAKVSLTRDVDHRLTPNTVEHNGDGIRCSKEAVSFSPEHINVIFLGDSYVYGFNTYPESAFPQQFELMANEQHPDLPVNVANFGWVSSSPYLSLRLLKDIGSKYNPDVVFLCIDMTDFHDDLKYEQLLERPRVVYKMLSLLPGSFFVGEAILGRLTNHKTFDRFYRRVFGFPKDRFFVVNRPLGETREYCERLISNVNDTYLYVTEKLGAQFVVAVLPRAFQYSARESPHNWEAYAYEIFGPHVYEPFQLFDELKAEVNYPVYSLLGAFRETTVFPTCFHNDPHWNESGHRIAAEAIMKIAENENVFARGLLQNTQGESDIRPVREY